MEVMLYYVCNQIDGEAPQRNTIGQAVIKEMRICMLCQLNVISYIHNCILLPSLSHTKLFLSKFWMNNCQQVVPQLGKSHGQ